MNINTVLLVCLAITITALLWERFRGVSTRALIWLKAHKPGNRFDFLDHHLINFMQAMGVRNSRAEANEEVLKIDVGDVKVRVIDIAKRAEEGAAHRVQSYGKLLEEVVMVRASLAELADKVGGPEAAELNTMYMAGLTNLAKAMDTLLQRQAVSEALLETIAENIKKEA